MTSQVKWLKLTQTGWKHAIGKNTWSDNKFRELIAVKVLHTSLLNITVVTIVNIPSTLHVSATDGHHRVFTLPKSITLH
jgi:hypothetical protein